MMFEEFQEEKQEVTVFFMTDNGEVISTEQLLGKMQDSGFSKTRIQSAKESYEESVKSITGSNQSTDELSRASILTPHSIIANGENRVVEPPYPVEVLQDFLEIEETHSRAVKTKATDSVCRGYTLKNSVPIKLKNGTDDVDSETALNSEATVERSAYLKDLKEVKKLIRDCNENVQFEGVLELAALDYEAIGWCAIEVIRSVDKKVRKLVHIPAARIKPMAGWEGFIEFSEFSSDETYYLPFGKKLVYTKTDPVSGLSEILPFNPDEVDISDPNVVFNLVDSKTGEPTDNFFSSANEVIWLKNHHPNTLYYGYADIIPAVGAVIGNANIRKYFLQFFDHNTVPRFAVIVEGAKISPDVMTLIHTYFNSEVKKTGHSTLILNVPSLRGEAKVRFEKLDTDQKEGDFLKTSESNRQAIMTAHGVSGAIIGISDAPELGSGKGLSQAEIYKDRIVVPRQKKWESALNELFRKGLGTKYVKIEFNPLDIRDREAEMRILTGYMDRGAVAVNDTREAIGMQPIEGGNRAFVKSRSGQLVFVDGFDDAGPVTPVDEAVPDVNDPNENQETGTQKDVGQLG